MNAVGILGKGERESGFEGKLPISSTDQEARAAKSSVDVRPYSLIPNPKREQHGLASTVRFAER